MRERKMEILLQFVKKTRVPVFRASVLLIAFLLLFSGYSWERSITADLVLELTGFVLLLGCGFGRLWVNIYIRGKKSHTLVTFGPYSVCRNPLYLFSLMGAIGGCLAAKNLLVLVLILFLFLVYYTLVIVAEERKLRKVFQESYDEYVKRVPRFLPRLSLYHDSETLIVKPRYFYLCVLSAMWFPLAFIILRVIQLLQEAGVLPVLFRVP